MTEPQYQGLNSTKIVPQLTGHLAFRKMPPKMLFQASPTCISSVSQRPKLVLDLDKVQSNITSCTPFHS
jgi:hypothetical protein